MKKSILIALALTVSLDTAAAINVNTSTQAQQQTEKTLSKGELRKQKKAEAEARQLFVIDSILTARSYTFVAERAITGQSDRTLTSRSTFIVNKTSVSSQLPYIGTSTGSAYSSSTSPLEFDAEDVKYQTALLSKKDGKAFVMINARNGTTNFTIAIEIFNNGSAAMSVQMSGGSGQTFYGYIEPTPQKQDKQ